MTHPKRWLPLLLLAPLASGAAPAAQTLVPRPASADVLAAFDLDGGTIQRLELPVGSETGFEVEVVLDGALRTLRLHPHDVRAADFELWVQDETGTHLVPASPSVTFRGKVLGLDQSVVAASLVDGTLQATVRLAPDQGLWSIQPLVEAFPGAARDRHVVYASADVAPLDVACGNLDPEHHGHAPAFPGSIASLPLGAEIVCELGIDADVQFYNLNGSSVAATQNDITTVMNNVEAIYQSQACIVYSIAAILVRTAEPDPYASSVPSTLLDEFAAEWISNQQAIQRDLAHLFTGRNLQGSTIGVAWLGGICSVGSGYGLSQSRFSPNLINRTGLTAHELGHNWGASHCNGTPSCRIMCSGLGGCSGSVTSFGPQALGSILATRDQAPCVSATLPPVLASVNADLEVFQGDPVTASGTLLSTARLLDVNGAVLNWYHDEFTIVDDSTIEFAPPPSPLLGPVPVFVTGTGGDSNAVTADYVPTTPAAMTAPGFVNPLVPFLWEFAADPGDFWFLFLSLNDPTTVPLLGFEVLASPFFSGFSGALGPAGRGTAATFGPVGSFQGLTLYSQVVTLGDVIPGLSGATNVTGSLFLF